MLTSRPAFLFVLVVGLVVAFLPALGQVVTSTVPAGDEPYVTAVNSATNKIYVANYSDGTVTVIDGATNNTATVNVGVAPNAVAVNPVTNKIYVANTCGNDPNCGSLGTVTVIDANNNNNTVTVNVGYSPYYLAVNSATNKIYVSNNCGNDSTCSTGIGTVTVIDANNNYATTTVQAGYFPEAVAVNPSTNKIYVANNCGTDVNCASVGTATVIDANNNNSTVTVNVGYFPYYVAANSATNQIYVSNSCGSDVTCSSAGTVTGIDANNNNNTTTATVGVAPEAVVVNSTTNQIYVVNYCGDDLNCGSPGTVTGIDANNNNNTTTYPVGYYPYDFLDIDSATNEIYVPNSYGNDVTGNSPGTVTVINATTGSTVPVAVGDFPIGVAVNATTNRIYISNTDDTTVSVISGDTTLQFVAVPPCRLLDTRLTGSPIQGGTFQTFNLPQLAQMNPNCANISSAAAFSLNPAVVPQGPLGYLTIWPAGIIQPLVATMNSLDGRVKANAAIVPAGVSSSISIFASNTTDVVVDVDGYFAPATQSTLAFYTLTPCRVADTRYNTYPQGLGAPYMPGGQPRDFPILNSPCFPGGLNPAVLAYSFNMTAVPHVPLGYMTVWPTGQSQPLVSTLNAPTGTVTANAALVPAGTGGDIDVYPSNDIDLVIDVNGYFAPPGQGGLSLYPVAPCRVLDTRNGNGAFQGELTVDVIDTVCGPPSAAQAYVFNATVVPSGPLGYLTLWPDGENQPLVATLNAVDGAITSNMAVVPTLNGSIDAYASNLTQLILDISSNFANPADFSRPATKMGVLHRSQRPGRPIPKGPVHKR